jgi:WD40 repeat protein
MSNDGMLRLYQSTEDGKYVEKANLAFGRNLQESICLSELGNDHIVLLVGGYDSKIHVYTIKLNSNKFIYRFSMLGHFNSIKALTVSPKLANDVFYLASGSQDYNIRIWKISPL